MTGYASAQTGPTPTTADSPAQPRLGLEIRAVNSRFLDLAFRLPDELRGAEPALRELLTARLKRGKVEVRATLAGQDDGGLSAPAPALLQRLATLQDNVQSWLPQARSLSVADVLKLAASAGPAASADLPAAAVQLAQSAIQDLLASREREGARLVKALVERIDQLKALAEQARPLVPQLVEQQRQRFLERWQDALRQGENAGTPASADTAQDRALSEATAFAIRIDVAEELTRLRAHLDELRQLLKKGGDIGKRLDFVIQELHREANTLGSKSATLELSRISVDMKVLIEQMREQVQNLE
ncbi:MAG: YicC/YloC family endoribonuclease [Comamonas sp.]